MNEQSKKKKKQIEAYNVEKKEKSIALKDNLKNVNEKD